MAEIETAPAGQTEDETNSLETMEDQVNPPQESSSGLQANPVPAPSPPPHQTKWWRRLVGRFNIYLLLFVLVLIIAIIIVMVSYISSRHKPAASVLSSQNLSQSTLQQLANSDATVGSNSQVLNVQSSAVFAGNVLVRQDLQVAGNLQIGKTLALNDVTVAGTAQFSQVQINNNLSVAGNAGFQSAVTIAKSLQVNGGANFNGPLSAPQLTVSSLQLNVDLVLTHHITTDGPAPGLVNGTALGSGGTASVSGSDTSGSISINTGSGPAAGCFVTINFASKFNTTPHILITPIGSSAGGLSYYVNRSAAAFSICDATTPPAGVSFGFDYFVVD